MNAEDLPADDLIASVTVHGVDLDAQTRCAHWHSPPDVIALKAPCCDAWYACKDCHDAIVDHPLEPWPRARRSERAVLCGVCRHQLTIDEYLACDSTCPRCGAGFNPGCAKHHHFYFAP